MKILQPSPSLEDLSTAASSVDSRKNILYACPVPAGTPYGDALAFVRTIPPFNIDTMREVYRLLHGEEAQYRKEAEVLPVELEGRQYDVILSLPQDIEERVNEFFMDMVSDHLHPLLAASIGYLQLLVISPFERHSTKMSMLMVVLYLLHREYPALGRVDVVKQMAREKDLYHRYMLEAIGGGDRAYWAEFFMKSISRAMDEQERKAFDAFGLPYLFATY